MASVTLCLLFIKKVHGWQEFFKYWYSIQISTQKLHALHLYAKLLFIISTDIYTSEYTPFPANPCNIYNVLQY